MNINNKNNIADKLLSTPGAATVLLVLFVVIGLLLISKYLQSERARDIMVWQSQLSLVAEIKVDAIESFLNEKKYQMQSLANNATLKLFLTQFENKYLSNELILKAQQSHVRNLLLASSDRFGLGVSEAEKSKLNLDIKNEYGLAVLDSRQQLIMSTRRFKISVDEYKNEIDLAYKTMKPKLIEIQGTQSKQEVFGYVVPVFKIQSEMKSPIGAVIALFNPKISLYSMLENRQSVTKSDETLLIKKTDTGAQYISHLKGGFKIFHEQVDHKLLAASYVLNAPGGFSEMKDYMGESVLVTGRKIKGSSWYLMHKVSSAEALVESNKHQRYLLTVFALVLLLVTVAFVAIWKHSTNARLLKLGKILESRTTLLNSVTDNIKEYILLLDSHNKIIFINPAFANVLKVNREEVKSVLAENIIGKEMLAKLSSELYASGNDVSASYLLNNFEREYHVTRTKLMTGEHENATLYVLHDISELKNEQKKRDLLAQGIINTLVKVVDLYDPYCANHSQRTREVACAIGKEMKLSEAQLEALEIASLLANIGKLFVPKEILTKFENLSDEESRQMRQHVGHAAGILSELPFNGPVVDIILQKNERLDGSGYPNGLVEKEILPESRILAVANAFVAMTSSRAYREGRKVNEVIDMLVERSESQYDRHVVAALFHIAENKADWKSWHNIDSA